MRMIITQVFQIEEHPNREKCYDWIRSNRHDLNQHSVEMLIKSIKALSNVIGGTFDYSISQVPSRGEHITFKGYDRAILDNLDAESDPLTGEFWDCNLIEGLREGSPRDVLDNLHDETEYIYSDEGLFELCREDGHWFNKNGKKITL